MFVIRFAIQFGLCKHVARSHNRENARAGLGSPKTERAQVKS